MLLCVYFFTRNYGAQQSAIYNSVFSVILINKNIILSLFFTLTREHWPQHHRHIVNFAKLMLPPHCLLTPSLFDTLLSLLFTPLSSLSLPFLPHTPPPPPPPPSPLFLLLSHNPSLLPSPTLPSSLPSRPSSLPSKSLSSSLLTLFQYFGFSGQREERDSTGGWRGGGSHGGTGWEGNEEPETERKGGRKPRERERGGSVRETRVSYRGKMRDTRTEAEGRLAEMGEDEEGRRKRGEIGGAREVEERKGERKDNYLF